MQPAICVEEVTMMFQIVGLAAGQETVHPLSTGICIELLTFERRKNTFLAHKEIDDKGRLNNSNALCCSEINHINSRNNYVLVVTETFPLHEFVWFESKDRAHRRRKEFSTGGTVRVALKAR